MKIDGNDKVRHAQIKIDYFMSASTKPLHGIGVILLSVSNPSESELLLPAKKRPEIDWQSVNRIVEENADFKDFIDLVSNYYQTGRVRSKDWNH